MENEQILITMLLFLLCGSVEATRLMALDPKEQESESFKVGPEFYKFMEEFYS